MIASARRSKMHDIVLYSFLLFAFGMLLLTAVLSVMSALDP